MTLGERVHLYRKRRQLTQAELAGVVGLDKMTISRLENNGIQEIRSGALARMAIALDVSADCLLGLVPRDAADV